MAWGDKVGTQGAGGVTPWGRGVLGAGPLASGHAPPPEEDLVHPTAHSHPHLAAAHTTGTPLAHGRWWRTSVTVLALALALTGCSGGGPDLQGMTFTSTDVRGHELVEGTEVTLAFTEDQISAQAGCNTMTAQASWDDGTLELESPLATTMMACDDALTEQDQWLSQFLESSPAINLDGTELILGDDSDGMTLTEQK